MLVIVNFGQVVDLERDGQFSYQFTVVDGGGTRIPISTDEETVRQLMAAAMQSAPTRTGGNNQPAHQPPQTSVNEDAFRHEMARIEDELEEDEQDVGEVFGGDYDPEDIAAQAASSIAREYEPVMGTIAAQPSRTPPQTGLGQGPRVRVDEDGFAMPPTAKTVPKDEMGYPIVAGSRTQANIPDDDGEDDGTQM